MFIRRKELSLLAVFLQAASPNRKWRIDTLLTAFGLPEQMVEVALAELIEHNLATVDLSNNMIHFREGESTTVEESAGPPVRFWQDDLTGSLTPWRSVQEYETRKDEGRGSIRRLTGVTGEALRQNNFLDMSDGELVAVILSMGKRAGIQQKPELRLNRVTDRRFVKRAVLELPIRHVQVSDTRMEGSHFTFVNTPGLSYYLLNTINQRLSTDETIQALHHPLEEWLILSDVDALWNPSITDARRGGELTYNIRPTLEELLRHPIDQVEESWKKTVTRMEHIVSEWAQAETQSAAKRDGAMRSDRFARTAIPGIDQWEIEPVVAAVSQMDEELQGELNMMEQVVVTTPAASANPISETLFDFCRAAKIYTILVLPTLDPGICAFLKMWVKHGSSSREGEAPIPLILAYGTPLTPTDGQQVSAIPLDMPERCAHFIPCRLIAKNPPAGEWIIQDGRDVWIGPQGAVGAIGLPFLGIKGSFTSNTLLALLRPAIDPTCLSWSEQISKWWRRGEQLHRTMDTSPSPSDGDVSSDKSLLGSLQRIRVKQVELFQELGQELAKWQAPLPPKRNYLGMSSAKDVQCQEMSEQERIEEHVGKLRERCRVLLTAFDQHMERVRAVIQEHHLISPLPIYGNDQWEILAQMVLSALRQRRDQPDASPPSLHFYCEALPPPSSFAFWTRLAMRLTKAGVAFSLLWDPAQQREKTPEKTSADLSAAIPANQRHLFNAGPQPLGQSMRGALFNNRILLMGSDCPCTNWKRESSTSLSLLFSLPEPLSDGYQKILGYAKNRHTISS
ncbi:MAG: hypothetical protein H7839_19830 [Magnetococcus sp. YQC-5]